MVDMMKRHIAKTRRALTSVATADDEKIALAAYVRAREAAYSRVRFEEGPARAEANDTIDTINRELPAALAAGYERRQAARRAESKRLRTEMREEAANSPTAWMRQPSRY